MRQIFELFYIFPEAYRTNNIFIIQPLALDTVRQKQASHLAGKDKEALKVRDIPKCGSECGSIKYYYIKYKLNQ